MGAKVLLLQLLPLGGLLIERATQIDDDTAWTAQQRVAEFVARPRPAEWTAPERVA